MGVGPNATHAMYMELRVSRIMWEGAKCIDNGSSMLKTFSLHGGEKLYLFKICTFGLSFAPFFFLFPMC